MDDKNKMEMSENLFICVNSKSLEQIETNVILKEGEKHKKLELKNNHAVDVQERKHQTSYFQTLQHLFKGNVGPGCYAMGDAFKNGGLVLAPILTVILGIVCVHAQHVLIICSEKMKERFQLVERPDYAETVELCFESSDRFKNWSKTCKRACNVFLCVTQLGFCCTIFLFIGTNVKQVLDFYRIHFELQTLIVFSLVPIWLTSMITNLKYIAPCSVIANICMISGITITFIYTFIDVPSPTERRYTSSLHRLPLFFGTTIFVRFFMIKIYPRTYSS
jgi:proton-coupled amino acid transporter